jgi:di/tricarboxylate transporter
MNLAGISVAALVLAIALSCFTQINVGILAIALAWIIGVYLAGMPVKQVAAGFPVDLFLTLAGVTLLFAQAQVNGTLERIAQHAVRSCRG